MADIDKILESRRQQTTPAAAPAPKENEDMFFSVLGGDVTDDSYLEFRFQDGFKLCLPYRDLVYFSYDPKVPDIKLDFGGTTICITGRGLGDELFEGLKKKRVTWIKEADNEMQDHDGNKVFIKDIGFEPEEKEAAPE